MPRKHSTKKTRPKDPTPTRADSDSILDSMWENAFDPYRGFPLTALVVAQNFRALRDALESPDGPAPVIKSLECGIETLFQFSGFHSAGRELYHLAVAGKLKPQFDIQKLADAAREGSDRR
jgi:hypothetical protein